VRLGSRFGRVGLSNAPNWRTLGAQVGDDPANVRSSGRRQARSALTTVVIEVRRIGEEAARILLRRIKSPGGSRKSVFLSAKLDSRSSRGGTRSLRCAMFDAEIRAQKKGRKAA
jgi:hypothetical protein